MKHIALGPIALVVGIFLFVSFIVSYLFVHNNKGALFDRKTVSYKIADIPREDNTIRRYQVVYEETATHQDAINNSNSSMEEISKDPGDFEAWAVAYLRSHINDTDLSGRDYKFLFDFRNNFKDYFPEEWQMKLFAIIETSFPNVKDDIKRLYADMDRYDAWLENNKNLLATMTADEIKAALRQKREDIFGNDVDQIWRADSKGEDHNDLLSIFNDALHISLEDKTLVFASVWDAMRNEAIPEKYAKIHKLQNQFLNMDSVQMQLQRMNSSQRADSLSLIRRIMGYADTKMEEMAKFDLHQDKQWHKGQTYMARRQDVVKKYVDGERELQLQVLRKRYFNQEANIIAAEEAAGIFRFKRKRIYGYR